MDKENVISNVRAFNRFYVDMIGLLRSRGYHSDYSLAETRVLYEINETNAIQASNVMHKIGIDKSYLSRILKKFEHDNLIIKRRSDIDARVVALMLTDKGKAEIDNINHLASNLVDKQIENITEQARKKLIHHMESIRQIYASGTTDSEQSKQKKMLNGLTDKKQNV